MAEPQSRSSVPSMHLGDSRLAPLAVSVRDRRRGLGLSRAQLADLAGCSVRFVHTVENAKPTLQFAKVLDVLDVLGLVFEVRVGRRRATERVQLVPVPPRRES